MNIIILQVKSIMEEAVTRKFVHEESSSITSLCGKYFGLERNGGLSSAKQATSLFS